MNLQEFEMSIVAPPYERRMETGTGPTPSSLSYYYLDVAKRIENETSLRHRRVASSYSFSNVYCCYYCRLERMRGT